MKKYFLIFLSLTLYPSLTLSFTLSALSGLELSLPTFGFVEIGLMYIYSFLPQPSRSELTTISFLETYFQFPAGKNVGELETFTI